MTRRRFNAPPGAFSHDQQAVTLAFDEARHLRDVLRLVAGDEIYIFDGAGREFQCVIEESRRDSTIVRVVAEVAPAKPESPLDLTLAVALLKGEKFDLVVQKSTELGVRRILPIITERADVRLPDDRDAGKRVSRWQRIALEAAKQCGRARVPDIASPRSLTALLASCTAEGEPGLSSSLNLFFSERDGQGLTEAIQSQEIAARPVLAMVGSEGGWTDEEIARARQTGCTIVTLGGRTLRAETAAIAVVALLQHLLGDLR